jgi:predicted phage terminase large subunit-like protein
MSTQPTLEQAANLLLARQQSYSSLIQFSRYIPIPNVPISDDGDAYTLIETPLATHHLLILDTLQCMTDNSLRYTLENGIPTPFVGVLALNSALPCPAPDPHGGSFDGGVAFVKQYPHLSKSLKHIYIHQNVKPPTRCKGSLSDGADGSIIGKVPELPMIYPEKAVSSLPSVLSNKKNIENSRIETCRRVMLMLPPGSAKSTYASVVFPSWEMGRKPTTEIILTGYGDVICKRHGKRSRQLCSAPEYSNIFHTGLDPNTRAADEWELTNHSSYKASGILSGITGFRCDGLIWDDLTKNRKDADSLTIRTDTYNAYLDDARSRKKPTAWEVGIGTRWHEDEIMGRILPDGYAGESGFMECRDGNVWFVLSMAAQCERDTDPLGREIGEYIWAEWFGEGYWVDKKINPRTWGSLYQQRPAPEEGIYFKADWKKTYQTLPEDLNYYISFDPAVSEEEDADDTCIQVWGVDQYARIYLIDEWVGKVTMDIWIDLLLDRVKKWKPMEVVSESGVIRRAAEPFLKRAMRKRKIFAVFEWMGRNADKSAMARPLQAMMAAGQVYFPENSVGIDTMDEFVRFPAGKNDHRVDAAANLCLRLEKVWESAAPEVIEENAVILGGGIPIKQLMPDRFPKKRSRWSLHNK